MKKLLIVLLLLAPLSAFAAMPTFPMSFYGAATINGTVAPVGTIIRAYYGTTLAGEVAVSEAGIYGYDNPTKLQLVVNEGSSTIRFAIESATINSGAETEGETLQTHAAFVSGDAVHKDLAFTWSAPTPPPPPPAPAPSPAPAPAPAPSPAPAASSGGGGGGGGGGVSVMLGCMDKKALNYSSVANRDNGACVYPVATTTMVVNANATGTTATSTQAKPKGEVLGAAAYIFARNLTVGMRGKDVSELQKRMIADGFFVGEATGYYGPLTMASVKKFQTAHGLEAVGNVGPKTRAALNSAVNDVAGSVLGTATIINAATSFYIFTQNLSIGASGNDALELQKRLTVEGVYTGPQSGYYGPLTAAAVKKYQATHQLEQVGSVGPLTRALLNGGQ